MVLNFARFGLCRQAVFVEFRRFVLNNEKLGMGDLKRITSVEVLRKGNCNGKEAVQDQLYRFGCGQGNCCRDDAGVLANFAKEACRRHSGFPFAADACRMIAL